MADALSYVLGSLRLSGSLFSRAELDSPWSIRSRGRDGGIFHAVVRGRCWARIDGAGEPVALERGDIVVLPGGHAHVMCDDLERPPVPLTSLPARREPGARSVPTVEIRSGGPRTSLLCGRFDFERSDVHPVLSGLPPLLHLRGGDERGAWMPAMLQLMVEELESGRAGAELVVTRLADVLVTKAARAVLERPPAEGPGALRGWLRGLTDPHVGHALGLVHREPSRPWTAASLAAEVGLSRSGLFDRFSELVGEPPTRYLTRWRMHVASVALRTEQQLSVAEVADRVGYTSESAFSKAFKRITGSTPSAFRRASTVH
ncbi:MAG: AraC family transcriptional regulator [Myxococcales bacterium]|nr:AraC family transcriptional regulator [Myxococcales bacterium]MCB9749765.1 AraC family transcriptional regulator [Myxococcales bacterium]